MPTRLIFVGGFLGAGKTTLLLRAAATLAEQGHRVGVSMNDQGRNLVDTALASEQALPRVEVAGGCFCCRFADLLACIRKLQATAAPDIILAEPVGSCAVAHVKLHMRTPGGALKASLTQAGSLISWDVRGRIAGRQRAVHPQRARTRQPTPASAIVRHTIAEAGARPALRSELTFLECFSPLPPQPTYRLLAQ